MNEQAITAFVNRCERIRRQIKALDGLMDVEDRYNPDVIHWGHVGDLEHVSWLLQEATNFLGRHSTSDQSQCKVTTKTVHSVLTEGIDDGI